MEFAGSIRDHVLVLKGGVPMFHFCNVDRHAAATTLAVLAQQQGAFGVIMEQQEKVFINYSIITISTLSLYLQLHFLIVYYSVHVTIHLIFHI